MGLASVCQNARFNMETVGSRWGLKNTMQTSTRTERITGLGSLVYIGAVDTQTSLVFDSNGVLWKESPAGSGILTPITPWFGNLPSGAYAQMCSYANSEWMALTDLKQGLAQPVKYQGLTGNLDPVSGRPFGDTWAANTFYQAGEVVTPVEGNGHTYRCDVAGTSGASEPAWLTAEGSTFSDGTVTWHEFTPSAVDTLAPPSAASLSRIAGSGTWAAGRDVYIKLTLVNGSGETDLTTDTVAVYSNTVLNDRLVVAAPSYASWMNRLGTGYPPTQYKVYVSDVAHGAGQPADSTFNLSATTAISLPTNVDTSATGAVGPVYNTAAVVPAGNVCTGTRYFTVLFRMRSGQIVAAKNGYITGYNSNAIFPCNINISSGQVFLFDIPTGPANCVQRIIAWGIADDPAGPAGSLVYIPEDDQTGVFESATIIDDNTTTFGFFNFDDTYLGQLQGTETDVSDFYLKMQVPPSKDITYLPSIDAMCYVGAVGYESSALISPRSDPETLYGAGDLASEMAVSPQDGERLVCVREVRQGTILGWKDNSVHVLNPVSGVAPSGWSTVAMSRKAGACGPRAVDFCSEFAIACHYSGVWMYSFADGSYAKISDEITNSWAQVNWAYKHLIWVCIDEASKVVHIGVPYGNSTVPNKTFTVNYFMGWDYPVHISIYGKIMTTHTARKWSRPNDIAAHSAIVAYRSLQTSVNPVIDNRQILFASAAGDGTVRMEVPNYLNDDDVNGNKVPIGFQYLPAFCQSEKLDILRLVGLSLAFTGTGQMGVKPVTENDTSVFDWRPYYIDASENNVICDGATGTNEYWSYLVANCDEYGSPLIDSAIELHSMTMYADVVWPGRRG